MSLPDIVWRSLLLVYTVLSALAAGQVLRKFLTPRPGWWWRILRYFAMMVAIGNVIYIGDPVNICFALPPVFAALFFSYRGSPTERLAFSMVFYALASTLSAVMDAFPRRLDYWGTIPDFCRMAAWVLIWLAVRRLLPREQYPLSTRMARLVGLLALLPLAGIVAAVSLSPYYIENPLLAYVLLPFLLLSALSILYTAAVLADQERLEQEASLLAMSRTYYKQLEEQQQQVRRLRHDMANHFTVLDGLLEADRAGDAAAYLHSLQQSPGLLKGRQFCENRVANTVLCAKAAVLAAEEVDFSADTALPEELPLPGPELGALLGNLLDNALEACRKLPPGSRWVRLTARADRGLLALRCVNAAAAAPEEREGKFLSSKGEPGHGLGTETVRDIVRRRGGTVEFLPSQGQFSCILCLPLHEKRIRVR